MLSGLAGRSCRCRRVEGIACHPSLFHCSERKLRLRTPAREGWGARAWVDHRVGHPSRTIVGGVIVNLEGDELTNDPSIDLQLVVGEGFFCRCVDRPSSLHKSNSTD